MGELPCGRGGTPAAGSGLLGGVDTFMAPGAGPGGAGSAGGASRLPLSFPSPLNILPRACMKDCAGGSDLAPIFAIPRSMTSRIASFGGDGGASAFSSVVRGKSCFCPRAEC